MRILVYEFVSGGGLVGREVPLTLAREGSAMLTALLEDLAAVPGHRLVTTADSRFALAAPPDVEVVTVSPRRAGARPAAVLDSLIASVDAVWLIAPETGGCLERLAARVEKRGRTLLGSGATVIRRAADKARLPRLLAARRVSHPRTHVLGTRERWDAESRTAARELGYPIVVKPARGAGCDGVSLARDARELRQALRLARQDASRRRLLLQGYVRGMPASVSLLADGRRAIALATNAQDVVASRPFSYRGGATPLEPAAARRAVEAASRACEAFPGLRGYVGVDLVLTESEAVVIEVNPRLTTSYLGVRAALDGNVAAMAVAACSGTLTEPPDACRRVRFTAAGRVLSSIPVSVPVRSRAGGGGYS